MSSYYATLITKLASGSFSTGCGSFSNISIDGRLSFDNAVSVARETFKKEASFKQSEYFGFAIEKLDRAWSYYQPEMIDTQVKAKDVNYLIAK